VGDRQPAWVDDAVASYTVRFPPQWRFRLDSVPAARRSGKQPAAAMREEGRAILAKIASGERVVLLDERGQQLTSTELASRMESWQADGSDLCFVIGGPDGVADDCRARADFTWSLSRLTLPHGMARVIVAEQLYRAWSLASGHPYHRN
jgi:23S rRNA (pseudouridine1915-N3)-methyltransferase